MESLTAAEKTVMSQTSSFGLAISVAGIQTSCTLITTFVWNNGTEFAHIK